MPAGKTIFAHISVSVDGLISDARHDPGFFPVDAGFNAYIVELLGSIGGMVFGHTAYAMLADFWPKAVDAREAALAEQARFMDGLPKYVLSNRPLDKDWARCERIGLDDLHAIKGEPGRPIAVFAGAAAVRATLEAGLLDELRLLRQPVWLGDGQPLFGSETRRHDLRLATTRTLSSGAVLESYAVLRRKR